MFEHATINQTLTNPLRNTVIDVVSGLAMEVVQMPKGFFVPWYTCD